MPKEKPKQKPALPLDEKLAILSRDRANLELIVTEGVLTGERRYLLVMRSHTGCTTMALDRVEDLLTIAHRMQELESRCW